MDITKVNVSGAIRFTDDIITPKGVTIFIRKDFPRHIRETGKMWADWLEQDIQAALATGRKSPSKLTKEQYLDEIERLAQIAEKLLSGNFDWDQYLPFTKAGQLYKNRTVLIADSKCFQVYADRLEDGYFGASTVNLRLVPVYANTDDWLDDRKMENALGLVMRQYEVSDAVPIFDRDGNITKPEKTRHTYIREKDLIPGCVYLNKKTKILYLGKQLHYSQITPDNRHIDKDWVFNRYLNYTKEVEETVKGCKSLQDVYDAIVAHTCKNGNSLFWWIKQRETPHKFTEMVCAVTDPAKPVPETIDISIDGSHIQVKIQQPGPH